MHSGAGQTLLDDKLWLRPPRQANCLKLSCTNMKDDPSSPSCMCSDFSSDFSEKDQNSLHCSSLGMGSHLSAYHYSSCSQCLDMLS